MKFLVNLIKKKFACDLPRDEHEAIVASAMLNKSHFREHEYQLFLEQKEKYRQSVDRWLEENKDNIEKFHKYSIRIYK